MKVTITLTPAEVAGIKAYLKDVDDTPNPDKAEVAAYINSLIEVIHAPQEAVSDYIRAFENK
jgi:hypothetical protein